MAKSMKAPPFHVQKILVRAMRVHELKVCFPYCLDKHDETRLRNGTVVSAFENCPKKENELH